jgi:DNA-binding LytR/AlgR family response regulator
MHFAEKTDQIDYCISCNDSVSGLKLLGNGDFDLLFLDLNMPNLNGKDVLELKQDGSQVIMITSDKEFAIESYRYNDVVDYLIKPLKYDRFLEAIERSQSKLLTHNEKTSTEEQRLMIKDGSKWIPVDVNSIHFIKSESNYCMVHTSDGVIMSLINLKNLLNKLPEHFIQSHRSFIVNTKFIDYLTKEEISISGKLIPISNKYKPDVKAYIESKS